MNYKNNAIRELQDFSKENVTGLKKRGRVLRKHDDSSPFKMEYVNKNAASNHDVIDHDEEEQKSRERINYF